MWYAPVRQLKTSRMLLHSEGRRDSGSRVIDRVTELGKSSDRFPGRSGSGVAWMNSKCLDPMRDSHSTPMAGFVADGQTVCILVAELNSDVARAVARTSLKLIGAVT